MHHFMHLNIKFEKNTLGHSDSITCVLVIDSNTCISGSTDCSMLVWDLKV